MQKVILTLSIITLIINSTLPADPFDINNKLGRGVNFGNGLDAPSEGEWGLTLQESHFVKMKELGFNSVRLPVRWATPARTGESPPYTVDEKILSRVQWAIDRAIENDLYIIVNNHHHENMMADPIAEHDRFIAIWTQVAERFKGYGEHLVFEIMNEPMMELTADIWNRVLVEALAVIRASNPTRVVMIGGPAWNNVLSVFELILPADDNIILTVHSYYPLSFTHQDTDWVPLSAGWLGTTWDGTYFEKMVQIERFNAVDEYAKAHNVPVNLGEYGAYERADFASRVRFTEFMTRLVESHGYSWHYWECCLSFGFYNLDDNSVNQELLGALISNDTSVLVLEDANRVGQNVLVNGDLNNGMDPWVLSDQTGSATAASTGSQIVISNPGINSAREDVQLIYENVTLENDVTYSFAAVVHSDTFAVLGHPTLLRVSMQVTNNNGSEIYVSMPDIIIYPQPYTYVRTFTANQDMTDVRIIFNVGGNDGQVYIDEVKLVPFTDGTGIFYHPGEGRQNDVKINFLQHTAQGQIINLDLFREAKVTFQMYDYSGRVLNTLSRNIPGGNHRLMLPLIKMPEEAGMILVKILVDGKLHRWHKITANF